MFKCIQTTDEDMVEKELIEYALKRNFPYSKKGIFNRRSKNQIKHNNEPRTTLRS